MHLVGNTALGHRVRLFSSTVPYHYKVYKMMCLFNLSLFSSVSFFAVFTPMIMQGTLLVLALVFLDWRVHLKVLKMIKED